MHKQSVLILGAGIGGIVLANELRRLSPHTLEITVIEKNAVHRFAPSFLWLMTGDRTPEQISTEVRRLLHPEINLVTETIVKIAVDAKRVETDGGSYSFDYLIIALGAEYAPESIPGLSEETHTYYSFEGANELQSTLQSFRGGKIALVVCTLPYKCPGAPHEGAMLIADHFRKRGMIEAVQMHLYTPEPAPMPVAGPELGSAVVQMLGSKRVEFHPLHKLISVDSRTRRLHFDGKEPVSYDLLITIPPHRSPRVVRESSLSNESGWIPVDRSSLKTKHENVFAIGDVAAISIPGRWKPDVPMMLPKAGVFAHLQAEIVAHHIAEHARGNTSGKKFPGIGYCMLEAGEGLAGFAYGDFFAEPSPQLTLYTVGRAWHIGKVLFEKWWLAPIGVWRSFLRFILNFGSRIMQIPVKM